MNQEALSAIRFFAIVGGGSMVLICFPAMWMAIRKRSLDGLIKWYSPAVLFCLLTTAIALEDYSIIEKLVLTTVMALILAVSSAFGYKIYTLMKPK